MTAFPTPFAYKGTLKGCVLQSQIPALSLAVPGTLGKGFILSVPPFPLYNGDDGNNMTSGGCE